MYPSVELPVKMLAAAPYAPQLHSASRPVMPGMAKDRHTISARQAATDDTAATRLRTRRLRASSCSTRRFTAATRSSLLRIRDALLFQQSAQALLAAVDEVGYLLDALAHDLGGLGVAQVLKIREVQCLAVVAVQALHAAAEDGLLLGAAEDFFYQQLRFRLERQVFQAENCPPPVFGAQSHVPRSLVDVGFQRPVTDSGFFQAQV